MKKYLAASTILAMLFVACTKNTDYPSDISGTWQWVRSVGGMTGRDTILPPANTTIGLVLKDGKYERTNNGQVASQGTYTIESIVSVFSAEKQAAIRFDNAVGMEQVIGWDNGQLVLIDNHTEPYGRVYKRVN